MNLEIVDQIWWYTSRAAGIVAWVVLSASMIAGLSMSTRAQGLPRTWKLDLHRFLSTMGIVFVAIHLAALVPDNFVHFSWAELFVPYASEWQPGAVAWGIVGFWVLVAVEISSLLKPRIPHKLWRGLHFLSFVLWVTATIHLLEAGTDTDRLLFRIAQVLVIGAVSLMLLYRIYVLVRRAFARRRLARRSRALTIEESIDIDQVDPGERRKLSSRRR